MSTLSLIVSFEKFPSSLEEGLSSERLRALPEITQLNRRWFSRPHTHRGSSLGRALGSSWAQMPSRVGAGSEEELVCEGELLQVEGRCLWLGIQSDHIHSTDTAACHWRPTQGDPAFQGPL